MENINHIINECVFCNLNREIIKETEHSISFYDTFPVSKGHALIIPKRHVSNYFDLSETEKNDCWKLLEHVIEYVQKKYNPDGFNIGINVNESAGQTIMHCHIHLIPRYSGDVENPKGGVRHVIPGKGFY